MIPVAVHSKGCWVRWTKVVVIPLLLVCCLHPYSHVRRTPSLVTRCCKWHIAFPTEGQCCSGWVRGEMRLAIRISSFELLCLIQLLSVFSFCWGVDFYWWKSNEQREWVDLRECDDRLSYWFHGIVCWLVWVWSRRPWSVISFVWLPALLLLLICWHRFC